jgi:hypothetical protein
LAIDVISTSNFLQDGNLKRIEKTARRRIRPTIS